MFRFSENEIWQKGFAATLNDWGAITFVGLATLSRDNRQLVRVKYSNIQWD